MDEVTLFGNEEPGVAVRGDDPEAVQSAVPGASPEGTQLDD